MTQYVWYVVSTFYSKVAKLFECPSCTHQPLLLILNDGVCVCVCVCVRVCACVCLYSPTTLPHLHWWCWSILLRGMTVRHCCLPRNHTTRYTDVSSQSTRHYSATEASHLSNNRPQPCIHCDIDCITHTDLLVYQPTTTMMMALSVCCMVPVGWPPWWHSLCRSMASIVLHGKRVQSGADKDRYLGT